MNDHRSARKLIIEPYKFIDRPLVRKLCCDVAYGGQPLEGWLRMSRDLFADLFTAGYTDLEPEHSIVARVDGEFAGYILMTPDTHHHEKIWRRRILLPALAKVMIGRYRISMSALPRLCALAFAVCKCGGLRIPLDRFPGHFHINIVPAFWRRLHVTNALMTHAFDHFRNLGIPGIHGVTMTSRPHMEEKYRRLGFEILKTCDAPRPTRRGSEQCRWVIVTMSRSEFPDDDWLISALRERSRSRKQKNV